MKGPIVFRTIQMVIGYHDEPIYAEDGITIITPAGLQIENQYMKYDSNVFHFISIINTQLYYIFTQYGINRTQAIDQFVLANAHNWILSYYPWLLDHMSLPSLEMLQAVAPAYREQVHNAIKKLKMTKEGEMFMQKQTHFETINIISGYHEEPIYAEDNATMKEPAGLQTSVMEIGLDIPTYKVDFITRVNHKLECIFSDENKDKRQQMIDVMMMTYAQSDIVKYYPWLLDYMSLPALVFLRSVTPLYNESITEAIRQLEERTQKLNTKN